MVDLTWKVFSQTGNIETYLLMKELENASSQQEMGKTEQEVSATMDSQI